MKERMNERTKSLPATNNKTMGKRRFQVEERSHNFLSTYGFLVRIPLGWMAGWLVVLFLWFDKKVWVLVHKNTSLFSSGMFLFLSQKERTESESIKMEIN